MKTLREYINLVEGTMTEALAYSFRDAERELTHHGYRYDGKARMGFVKYTKGFVTYEIDPWSWANTKTGKHGKSIRSLRDDIMFGNR